eukprot:2669785-Pleurochrysis_carterae.AAC.1
MLIDASGARSLFEYYSKCKRKKSKGSMLRMCLRSNSRGLIYVSAMAKGRNRLIMRFISTILDKM